MHSGVDIVRKFSRLHYVSNVKSNLEYMYKKFAMKNCQQVFYLVDSFSLI